MAGISNVTIEKFIEENDDLKNIIVVVLSDHITHFKNFYRIIKGKGSLYPFAILNTSRKSQPGTH